MPGTTTRRAKRTLISRRRRGERSRLPVNTITNPAWAVEQQALGSYQAQNRRETRERPRKLCYCLGVSPNWRSIVVRASWQTSLLAVARSSIPLATSDKPRVATATPVEATAWSSLSWIEGFVRVPPSLMYGLVIMLAERPIPSRGLDTQSRSRLSVLRLIIPL